MKYDKQYHVSSAIYRMLRKRLIDQRQARELLKCRAGLKASLAKAVSEQWVKSFRARLLPGYGNS